MRKHPLSIAVIFFLSILFFSLSCKNTTDEEGFLEVSGLIEAIETEIRPQISGEVIEIHVREGQQVEKGDLLCRIDDKKISVQLSQIQAGLEGLRAKLRLYRKGNKKEVIAMAKNQLDTAREELRLARKNQERLARLLAEGAVSEAQKEEADLRLKAASEKVETAEENYRMSIRGREKEELEIVEAEIKNLTAQERLLKIHLEETRIDSPASGFIETRHIELGETASPLLPLFSLVDFNQTYVKAFVPEKYLGQIQLGSEVSVVCDSFPEKTFKGTVDFIADQAEFAPKNIQTKEERLKLVFMIKSYLPNSEMSLKPGMPVDVRIAVNR
jgi:HlyD family secretion protein